jgi:hypothetical protein
MAPSGAIFVSVDGKSCGYEKKPLLSGRLFRWSEKIGYFEDAFFFSTVTVVSTVVGVAVSVS